MSTTNRNKARYQDFNDTDSWADFRNKWWNDILEAIPIISNQINFAACIAI